MIAPLTSASTAQRVMIERAASTVNVQLARPVCCVIWTMLVSLIPVMLAPSVIQTPSMGRMSALAHRALKARTAPRISTSVISGRPWTSCANMEERVGIPLGRIFVIVRRDSRVPDVSRISTSARPTPARMMEPVWMSEATIDVFACQVLQLTIIYHFLDSLPNIILSLRA